jgi:hypothetical protein
VFVPPALQTPPQIMVLGGEKVLPAASLKVSICSHAKIGSVDVWVGSVRVNQVRVPESFRNERWMFDKGVHSNDAGYGGKSSVCEGQLILQPARRHLAVRVRVCQPAAISRPGIAFQCALHPESTSSANATHLGFDDSTVTLNEVARDFESVVRRLVCDNNQITRYMRGEHQAGVLNGS